MTTPVADLLARFARLRLLIVGDVMLDRFVYGRIDRVSPEAPALVLAAQRQSEMPGGAANVARNICGLGAACTLVGVAGMDIVASELRAALAGLGRVSERLVADPARPTTLKVRFVSPVHNTHLLRLDAEDTAPVSGAALAAVLDAVAEEAAGAHAVIVSDYGKGVVTPAVMAAAAEAARRAGVPVIVDPKGKDYTRYQGAAVVCPNLAELSEAVGRKVPQDDAEVERACAEITARTGIRAVVAKRSEHGVQVVEDGRTTALFPSRAARVVDVSGAGDTLVATLATALAAGATLTEAARIANAAAAVVVAMKGTAAATLDDVAAVLLDRHVAPAQRKLYADVWSLRQAVLAWQEEGASVGFTNGCFDLLHPGHIHLLTEARNRVDRLILALNSDASARRLKGPGRPIQNQVARSTVAAALEPVDAVILFEEDTPLELITRLQPNVLFKGGDYTPDQVVGRDVVEAYGGRVEIISYMPENSTTGIVRRMAAPARDAALAEAPAG